MAEIAKKPLYRVTCGDIGTNADEVEKVRDSWEKQCSKLINSSIWRRFCYLERSGDAVSHSSVLNTFI